CPGAPPGLVGCGTDPVARVDVRARSGRLHCGLVVRRDVRRTGTRTAAGCGWASPLRDTPAALVDETAPEKDGALATDGGAARLPADLGRWRGAKAQPLSKERRCRPSG